MQLNREVDQDGQIPAGGMHAIVDITPYVLPEILGRSRRHSGGRFYLKLARVNDSRAVFHKQASEMITAGVANGLGKEEVGTLFNAAYLFVFTEQCLLDGGINVGVGKSGDEESTKESTKLAAALTGASVGGGSLPSFSVDGDNTGQREDGASESRDELSRRIVTETENKPFLTPYLSHTFYLSLSCQANGVREYCSTRSYSPTADKHPIAPKN